MGNTVRIKCEVCLGSKKSWDGNICGRCSGTGKVEVTIEEAQRLLLQRKLNE